MYSIAIDSNNNVFGHFISHSIDSRGHRIENKMFMFILHSKQTNGQMKFELKKGSIVRFWINNDDYIMMDKNHKFLMTFDDIGKESSIHDEITQCFECPNNKVFTGSKSDKYVLKRMIVIQMKDSDSLMNERKIRRNRMLDSISNKCITSNIAILEEWSGKKYKQVI